MNILPKKRWHVRTKENIARVRKDEAEAAEKGKQERLRIEKADREARLNVLKHKSKQHLLEHGIVETKTGEIPPKPEHINLFANFEDAIKTTNKDHDKELKEKKEEYEKKIGYLTYLGQDTNEALSKKNWYEVTPEASRTRTSDIKDTYDKLILKDIDGKPKIKENDEKDGEIGWKKKQHYDPLNAFRHLHDKDRKASKTITKIETKKDHEELASLKKHRHKKEKKHKKEQGEDKLKKIQKLREARLRREQQEKYRTELFLTGLNKPTQSRIIEKIDKVVPKYNSQFNPEYARQNYK